MTLGQIELSLVFRSRVRWPQSCLLRQARVDLSMRIFLRTFLYMCTHQLLSMLSQFTSSEAVRITKYSNYVKSTLHKLGKHPTYAPLPSDAAVPSQWRKKSEIYSTKHHSAYCPKHEFRISLPDFPSSSAPSYADLLSRNQFCIGSGKKCEKPRGLSSFSK